MNSPSPSASPRPELLAPAGDWDCVRAAIENGADAVYFGLDCGFNARARAHNFPVAELPAVLELLHSRGVKGYVTLNTLAFPGELPQVEKLIAEAARAGIDALLVQDLGVLRLARAICPQLPIHASTQMTLTSGECIAPAEELGAERVVLARELSIDDVRRIRATTKMPLEVFVHGALCVAYSGQCLTSESLGGRSANRGQCAQACRLPYDLVCDGKDVDLGEQKYLLSPQDLAAYGLIRELLDVGVCSFKIEGRLKTPEYVANITRHYRRAIDEALAGRAAEFSARDVEEMELSFSRGFSPGWLRGDDHKMLVPALSSSKRGVLVGEVVDSYHQRVVVRMTGRLKRGDGVVFDCGRPVDDEQGGRVYEIFVNGRSIAEPVEGSPEAPVRVELTFAHNSLDWPEIRRGQRVFKTDDPELTNRLRKSYTGLHPQRRLPVDLAATAEVGQPLQLTATLDTGHTLSLASEEPLAEARQHALGEATLRDQLGRLGGTEFELREVTANVIGRPMAPFSVLGKLRHSLVESLRAALKAPLPRTIRENVLTEMRAALPQANSPSSDPPQLHVLCRSLPQLREVLAEGVKQVYVDFADIREYRPATEAARAAGASIFLATTRIQRPDEMGIYLALAKHGADGFLVRNLSGLRFCAQQAIPFVADFSLNAANELTAEYLQGQGARRITPSYDLNREQLLELVAAVPPAWLEPVIHQHMPMFHMEHCVFCSVLSPGTNKTNCGRPCDTHQVKLRDRIGMEHPLHADVGCRNTLFNAVPQSAAEAVPALLARGVRHFRLELLEDSGAGLKETLDVYRRLLAGEVTGKEVWTKLRASNRVGVTRGTLEERRDPLAIL